MSNVPPPPITASASSSSSVQRGGDGAVSGRRLTEAYEQVMAVDELKYVITQTRNLYAEHRVAIEIDPSIFLLSPDACMIELLHLIVLLYNRPSLVYELARISETLVVGKQMENKCALTAIRVGQMLLNYDKQFRVQPQSVPAPPPPPQTLDTASSIDMLHPLPPMHPPSKR